MLIACSCGKQLRVRDDAVGKMIKCPACGDKVMVPGPAAEPPDEPPDEPATAPRRRASRGGASGGGSFVFDGGAADFLGTAILAWLLTVFTLGFGYPWALCMIQGWKAHHTLIDGRRLRFVGGGGGLFGLWIKWFLLCMITFGIYTFWVVPDLQRWIVQNTEFDE